jgi:hypothetical protein
MAMQCPFWRFCALFACEMMLFTCWHTRRHAAFGLELRFSCCLLGVWEIEAGLWFVSDFRVLQRRVISRGEDSDIAAAVLLLNPVADGMFIAALLPWLSSTTLDKVYDKFLSKRSQMCNLIASLCFSGITKRPAMPTSGTPTKNAAVAAWVALEEIQGLASVDVVCLCCVTCCSYNIELC